MKFTSPVYSQASGAIAGLVYSHNHGGMYTRARATPTNPSSARQVVVRNAVANLSNWWSNVLTAANRTSWNVYATNVPLVGPLGTARKVSGIAMYVRSNTPRIQSGLTPVTAGPGNFTLGSFTNPAITASHTAPEFSVAFTNTDSWAIAVGGAMLIYASRPQSAGITFFDGPYVYAGKIAGAVSPPTSPQTIASPFPLTAGQQVFFRVEVSQVDGRLSAAFRASAIVG